MIERPPAGESPSSALGMARFYNEASLRILLSDSSADIMSLPGIDNTEYPYPLAELGSTNGYPTGSGNYTVLRNATIPSTYCPQNSNCTLPLITPCTPPMAESVGASTNSDYMTAAGTTLLGGYIKIEMQLQSTPGTWKDVTEEILAQGISRDEGAGTAMAAAAASGPSSGGSLAANTTYYYTVTAVNAYGESAGTQTAGVTTTSGASAKETIALTWTAITGATGYNIYRTTTSGNYTGAGNGYLTQVAGTSYTDSGATSPTATNGPPSSSCTNSSIIHLEEAATGVNLTSSSAANLMNVLTPTNFVPINMYDPREGEVRDVSGPTTSSLNGIMNLVEVDVHNLQQWFAGNIATSGKYAYNGPDAINNSGYILYTSDRRMNCMDGKYDLEGTCASNVVTGGAPTAGETGGFGNEDIINEANVNGAPNQTLDSGEDVNANGVLDYYGTYAHPIATPSSTVTPAGTTPSATWNSIITSMADTSTGHPAFVRITNTQAQDNSVVIFRRALRLVNGTLGNLPPLAAAQANPCSGGTAGGFSVASENPIYVQGDYNSSVANAFNDAAPLCHVPASVMGDAVTLLSNAWQPGAQSGYQSGDYSSFEYPTSHACGNPNKRCAKTTYYRMAVMAGKVIPFPAYNGTTALLGWGVQDTGSDGGIHNFLRYVEDWGGSTLNYTGSLASFYISQQATGIYKYPNTVYGPPTRNYTFDTDFQDITKLPPGSPRFTDVNALSYYQSVLSSQ
jgi:hypothetical protein